ECLDLASRPIDPDPRVHLDGVPLDARLELLQAVMGEADRTAGKEHRREREVEREGRMGTPAEAAAEMGEMTVDARRPKWRAGFAEQERNRFRDLVRRLRADHELEACPARIEPGETAFRLQKHRVDRLDLEIAVEH